MKNPFIDFYNKFNVIPTKQNLKNLNQFLHQRNYLYTCLGVPLSNLKGKNILEFGPGGGWNAIATSLYEPNEYVMVDKTKKSIEEIKLKIKQKKIKAKKIKIVEQNIFQFKSKKKYDLVIIEGVIPNQKYPEKMLKHVSKFVKKGGKLIITTHSQSSLLSEFCRRLFRNHIFEEKNDFKSRVNYSSKIFSSHLKKLDAVTRPVEDWVIDVIIQDQTSNNKIIFTMEDSLKIISKKFDFYNSQPKFLIDDRFYKTVKYPSSFTNDLFFQQIKFCELGLIDCRVSFKDIIFNKKYINLSKKISELAKNICFYHNEILNTNSYFHLAKTLKLLDKISILLPKEFYLTKKSIKDFTFNFPLFLKDKKLKNKFIYFEKWWGRGMQYMSFIKK